MRTIRLIALAASLLGVPELSLAADPTPWPQWRGPSRDGQVQGETWPDRLDKAALEKLWRVPLDPSYSGPIVSGDLVFTTETKNKESEVAVALDRKTGKERWRTEWKGAMTVPFFAASNGSWIRATPAYDSGCLYVAGMRDELEIGRASCRERVWR